MIRSKGERAAVAFVVGGSICVVVIGIGIIALFTILWWPMIFIVSGLVLFGWLCWHFAPRVDKYMSLKYDWWEDE